MGRCAGIKKDGGRCTVELPPGNAHCYSHDPDREAERKRNASRGGRSKGNGELSDLKQKVRDLAADVLKGKVETGRAAVTNQLYNTLIRAIEQERKQRETDDLAERMEALEETLKGRRGA